MTRNIHSEMAAAAHSLAKSGKIAKRDQQKLSRVFTLIFGEPPRATEKSRPTQRDHQKAKRPRTAAEKTYRTSKARKVYHKALKRGSCYFFAFALCVTATDCRDSEITLFPEQDKRASEIWFALNEETLALFRSWARFNGYDSNEAFVSFIDKLRELPGVRDGNEEKSTVPSMVPVSVSTTEAMAGEQSALNDFDVISKIVREKGLTGNTTVRETMRVIFPEQAYKTWPLRFGLAPMVDTTSERV